MVPAETIDRFRADLDPLIAPGERIGVAVSGGPDSMALLILAASARPGEIEAATVDHGLRAEGRAEAEMVATICNELGVPHAILPIEWDPPKSAVQEKARVARYGSLSGWMRSRALDVLLTAHHLDDQAETVLMRLNRGSGSKGLAGMRPLSNVPGAPDLKLVRPLLHWRRTELETICEEAGVSPAADPSNNSEEYERVRVRNAISEASWLDAQAIARSAENLAAVDEALAWAAEREWAESVAVGDGEVNYSPSGAPAEIVRRVIAKAIAGLGNEGRPEDLRGNELGKLIDDLRAHRTATLRGVLCRGGGTWRFTRANPRKS